MKKQKSGLRHLEEDHGLQTDNIFQQMKRLNIKLTTPRKAIIEVLAHQHGPFTIEEVYQLVTNNVCDKATVYRCLTNFLDHGFVRKCEFGDGVSRYELASERGHHHHIICKICSAIEVLDNCSNVIINQIAANKGFSNISHSLEFFGHCPNCVSQSSK